MEKKDKPLVSFCMSTYKRPEILKNQLITLLQQEYENFEIVISDNDTEGSGKSAVDAVNDPRIKYQINEVNLGMVKSFNKSVERSSGDYIVMITDDDPAYPHMLSILIELSFKYPEYGVYAGCGDLIIENDFSQKTLNRNIGTNSTILKSIPENTELKVSANNFASMYLDGFFSKTYLLWSCSIIRRDIILHIKGMPDYGSEFLTDHAFIIAAASYNGLVYINKSMGGQLIHGGNFGYNFSSNIAKFIKTPELFYAYLKPYLEKNNNWKSIEKKIWKFAGRSQVEYSLMILKSLHQKKDEKNDFFKSLNAAFSNKHIHVWKYKFYLKAYFNPLFKLLILIKNKLMK